MRWPADRNEVAGTLQRQVGLRGHVARGDAVAEAVLQRHAQQRQRLGLRRAVLDAGAHRDQAATGRVRFGAELVHVVGAQVPVREELHAEGRVERGEGPVEARAGREIVAVVIDDLRDEHERGERGTDRPGVSPQHGRHAALLGRRGGLLGKVLDELIGELAPGLDRLRGRVAAAGGVFTGARRARTGGAGGGVFAACAAGRARDAA